MLWDSNVMRVRWRIAGQVKIRVLLVIRAVRTFPPLFTRRTVTTLVVMRPVFRCSQRLLRLLAGFAGNINLNGGQIGAFNGHGIAAAGLPDVRAVSLADAN